ncbi:beta-ketoacyl synthase N-terminal-like domain-containing protein [Streptomyces sp. NPDC088260]|uniref:beta-ketoacyl synthase N-terminal-like domain-containing protein n=1 Tax=Streptomyces sp. NPDC088260 TaxID=3365850 RepID=UPI0037F1DA03
MPTEYTSASAGAVITGVGAQLPACHGANGLWRAAMKPGSYAVTPASWSKPDLLETVIDEALVDAGFIARPRRPVLNVMVVVCAQADARQSTLPPFLHGADADVLATCAGPAPVTVLSHACATGGFAIRMAVQLLAARQTDVVVVAGASVSDPMEEMSLEAVGVLAKGVVRPLDTGRDGMAVGRGAIALVLERPDNAAARGRTRTVGVANAACLVKPSRAESDPAAVSSVLRTVLCPADGAEPKRVDAVCSHATGTVLGDEVEFGELALLGKEFGWNDVPVFSNKGAIGHLLHTSALASVAHAAEAMRRSVVPSTAGCASPMAADPAVHVSTESSPASLEHVLVNAFGFGGNYASVLLQKNMLERRLRDE